MDPESRKLLEDTHSLAEENNMMLRAMRRSMFWAHVSNILYWLIIIGISIGACYFLQPYMNRVVQMYDTVSTALKNFQSVPK